MSLLNINLKDFDFTKYDGRRLNWVSVEDKKVIDFVIAEGYVLPASYQRTFKKIYIATIENNKIEFYQALRK